MSGYEWAWVAGLNGFDLVVACAAARSASTSRTDQPFLAGLVAAVWANLLLAFMLM